MMSYERQYKAKLADSHSAAEQVASNSIVAIGQAVCQPPGLMEALAARAEAGSVDNVKVYYMHAEENMKKSLLRYELMGRIKPYCMFLQEVERGLIKQGQEDGWAGRSSRQYEKGSATDQRPGKYRGRHDGFGSEDGPR
jgi:itaconate CoA-transferase